MIFFGPIFFPEVNIYPRDHFSHFSIFGHPDRILAHILPKFSRVQIWAGSEKTFFGSKKHENSPIDPKIVLLGQKYSPDLKMGSKLKIGPKLDFLEPNYDFADFGKWHLRLSAMRFQPYAKNRISALKNRGLCRFSFFTPLWIRGSISDQEMLFLNQSVNFRIF